MIESGELTDVKLEYDVTESGAAALMPVSSTALTVDTDVDMQTLTVIHGLSYQLLATASVTGNSAEFGWEERTDVNTAGTPIQDSTTPSTTTCSPEDAYSLSTVDFDTYNGLIFYVAASNAHPNSITADAYVTLDVQGNALQ